MPIARMRLSEGPSDSVQSQPAPNDRILINVKVVVVINEAVSDRLSEHGQGKSGEKNADAKNGEVRILSLHSDSSCNPRCSIVPAMRNEKRNIFQFIDGLLAR